MPHLLVKDMYCHVDSTNNVRLAMNVSVTRLQKMDLAADRLVVTKVN